MAVRPQDLVFYAGGECLRDYGVLVKRTSPGEEIVETYTRTGTPQNPDPAGKLIKTAANVPVVSWWDDDGDGVCEVPRLQLEAGLTNLMTEADLDAWGKVQTPIVTAIPGPDGNATSAFTIEDNDAVNNEYIYEEIFFTGDAVKSIKIAVKENTMPGSGNQSIVVFDVDDGFAARVRIFVTSWIAGNPQISMDTGVLLGKWQIGSTGWWVLECQTTSVTVANDNRLFVYPAYNNDQTGKIDVFKPAAYDSAVPLTSILNAGETLGASSFSYPFPFPPQKAYFYAKFRERGTIQGTPGARLLHLGDTGNSAPGIFMEMSGGRYNLVYNYGDVVQKSAAAAPSVDDLVEIRAVLDGDGKIQLGQSINSEAEAVTSLSAAQGLASAWSAAEFYLNSRGTNNVGFNAFDAVKVVLDPEDRDYTLDELRAAA